MSIEHSLSELKLEPAIGESYKKRLVNDLNSNSINHVELLDNNNNSHTLATCSDTDITLYNESTNTRHTLYQSTSKKPDDDEISYLKSFHSANYMFAANGPFLQLFNIEKLKPVDRFKFCKETINCIDVRNNNSHVTICDDSGQIKLIDVRIKPAAPMINLTLNRTLDRHRNICFVIRYHPHKEHELFSGSFDCSVLKWDLRFAKSQPAKIDLTSVVNGLNTGPQPLNVYSMTPCFVHSVHFTPAGSLLCGLENGLCVAFDPESLAVRSHTQTRTLNRALTQMVTFQEHSDRALIAMAGDQPTVDFIYESPQHSLVKYDALLIDHQHKVNSLKHASHKLYVADTSPHLTIYDFY